MKETKRKPPLWQCPKWKHRFVNHPLLIKTDSYGQLGFGLHFRLSDPQDIDQAMIDLLGQAYDVGKN